MELPEPSWEIFDECRTCCTAPKKPCYDVRSTSKNLKVLSNPHAGRKRLKRKDPWHPVLPV